MRGELLNILGAARAFGAAA
jgi:hypothetical protein